MRTTIIEPTFAPYQEAILNSLKRFTITEGTTKGGKTFTHYYWLFKKSQSPLSKVGYNYWWIAPSYNQSLIAFNRLYAKIKNNPNYRILNSSPHTIITPIGSKIVFKTGDDPDSLYGEDVYAAVIDEGSRMKEAAFHAIRSTLVATNGEMKLIGNVKGIDNWYYELARKVQDGLLDNWEYFKFTADDAVAAGILKQEEINEARVVYPEGIFLELFYAIPFINLTNKFAFSFSTAKHVGQVTYNPIHPLYISFDFNRNPICCTVFQHYDKHIWGVECIKLPNSNIYQLCDVITTRYPKALIIVNGDATGQASSALVKDNLNYYKVIKTKLNLSPNQVKVPTVNPSIAENQVLVNGILEHYPLTLDATNCAGLIRDLQFVEMLPDGTIKKGDREDPKQQADALDTLRYYLNTNFKWFLRL